MNLYSWPRKEIPVFTSHAKFISAQKFFNYTKAKTSHVNTQSEQIPWKMRQNKKTTEHRRMEGSPPHCQKHFCLQTNKHTHWTIFIHYEDGTPLHLHEGYYSGCYLLQDHFQRLLLFKNQAGKVKKHLNKRLFVRVGLIVIYAIIIFTDVFESAPLSWIRETSVHVCDQKELLALTDCMVMVSSSQFDTFYERIK